MLLVAKFMFKLIKIWDSKNMIMEKSFGIKYEYLKSNIPDIPQQPRSISIVFQISIMMSKPRLIYAILLFQGQILA